jgi:hypothetical protein
MFLQGTECSQETRLLRLKTIQEDMRQRQCLILMKGSIHQEGTEHKHHLQYKSRENSQEAQRPQSPSWHCLETWQHRYRTEKLLLTGPESNHEE